MKRLVAGAIVMSAAVVAAGCGGEVAKVAAGRLVERSAAQLAAREAAVAVAPSFTKISARSTLLTGGADAQRLAVRSQATAAAATHDSPIMRQVAQESDEQITLIAAKTTRDPGASVRVTACAKGGAIAAARSYVSSYLKGDSTPDVETTIMDSVSSCLQRAFPNQATAVRSVGKAVTNSILASSRDAGDAQATAQDYADWLVYCAKLYAAEEGARNLTTPRIAPTATDVSVDDLLVVLYHAHAGRLAVGDGDWSAAIANRTSVLNELGRLDVASELEGARQTLIRAMRASLAADRYHAACGACAAPYDAAATDSKRAFIGMFNPYLLARYGATVDASQL
jgi:hypothetical protein